MKKTHLLIMLSFLMASKTYACLNGETKILKNGVMLYEDNEGIYPEGHHFYIEHFPKLIRELDSMYKATKDLDYLSDKGYVLIIKKKYDEALKIYLEIEKVKPNRYSTASNIGTIYELIGENTKAYEWIKKAIKINSKSHNSSEWLHLKILEAKIKGDKYITSEFLLNTNFGNDTIPKSNFSKIQKEKLISSLYYQLNERISFIKSKDKIIGLLLFELGNLALINEDNYSAKDIYIKAKEYGYESSLINIRIGLCNENIQDKLWNENIEISRKLNYQLRVNNNLKIFLIILSMILVASIVFIIKLKRKTPHNRA